MMPYMELFRHPKMELEDIKSATNNFDDNNCIGRGGFGKVYKGQIVLRTGENLLVAFKRLDPKFGQGNPEFWKEIMMLSLYKHENIISLLGFCDDDGEKILVYEYASNGSLDKFLNNKHLTWAQRLKICIGAARGIAYLHDPGTTQQRVLHRDIKSSNKISDFGLSKLGPANQPYTFLVSQTVGTPGYCDPLYATMGFLTKESDVYSFGIVLFEILCGRLCISHELLPLLLVIQQCKISESIFDYIKGAIHPRSLKVFTSIAYQCIKKNFEKRPSMSEVVNALENALEYQSTALYTKEAEWVEEDEPGVYITIRQLTDGTREVHRIRFNREEFGKTRANLWWKQNVERIQAQYLW